MSKTQKEEVIKLIGQISECPEHHKKPIVTSIDRDENIYVDTCCSVLYNEVLIAVPEIFVDKIRKTNH